MDEKVYTIKEAAKKVRYSERQLREKCIEGKMPDAYKIPAGRKWLIPEHSIKAFNKNLEAPSIIKTHQNGSVAAGTKQDPFEEKPATFHDGLNSTIPIFDTEPEGHINDVRKLARTLIGEMHPRDEFLKHLNRHEFDHKEADLFQELTAHIQNSEFSSVWTAMEQRIQIRGEILGQWYDLLKIIVNDVSDGNKLTETLCINGETLMRSQKNKVFPVTLIDLRRMYQFDEIVCINAIGLARGFQHMRDLIYTRQPSPKGYELKSGKYTIAILRGPVRMKFVEYWEKLNREMSVRYSKHVIAHRIGKMISDLETLEHSLNNELEKFIRVIPLPGYCNVCKKAQGLLLSPKESV